MHNLYKFYHHIRFTGVCRIRTTLTGPWRTETTSSASPLNYKQQDATILVNMCQTT